MSDLKFIANLGDASPVEYGGYFLYQGPDGFVAEKLVEPADDIDIEDDAARWTVYCFDLERFKPISVEEEDGATLTFIVPIGYDASWPHPAASYVPWFFSDLRRVADFIGSTRDELIAALCGNDGKALAWAYQAIADYHGWENLDSYPLTLTRPEVDTRYTDGEV